ncbi:hypothetical protein BG53_02175 [Paenibacillus darwinianus]|uniref:Uncharacterized protein n=1 Tax=Paenibacillus darwinianus TaxID=1380763 RepID=A0A9W5W716_9BACL|nr:hypothetical protein [Paenibacillus darwinianus]EXX85564.1 hypothetical protein BG52_08130 [Paenibacillus darwinianus]EXX88302.1 hypothetical protein BG53_02175 [Paenibacillus darwinianus]EXX89835.1 hypothetical protein CH50_00690 [Paenibacillus darwinianus]
MNKSYEVEYCNLEIRFDRRQIHNLIRDLIQAGYSLYWSETEAQFLISIRTGRKLVKLRFQRIRSRYKIVGDYVIKDEKLSVLLERLINDSRGHAVVKRIKDRQIVIESIMFGEIIRLVEVSGMEHRIIYQKKTSISTEEMMQAFQSKRAEERVPVLRLEIDYELASLSEALREGRVEEAAAVKERLAALRTEMLQLEM